MKIHYYMQFFPGANVPGSQQPMTLARFLADRGHQISVLSSDYNLDTGLSEDPVEYAGPGGGSLKVLRFPSPRGGRGSLVQRLRSYIAFMFTVRREGMKLDQPDVILGSIQPLFTGWAAMQVACKKRVPFLLEVRDLWPDALVVKGAITGWQATPLHWIVNRLYHNAQHIVSITPGIKKELLKKGIAAGKVEVFPNGFDPQSFDVSGESREAIQQRYDWGDDFVAIYTGAHTQVTAVDVIVRAASVLKDREEIRFELFGAGPTKEMVVRLADELELKNIHFHNPVPKSEVPGLLAAADVALMCLFKSPLVHIYFENKFIDYMGAGKPILAAMEGEQAAIIRRWQTGRVVSTFDHESLAHLIAEAADNFAPFAAMGENGRRLVRERFLLPTILDRYAHMLEAVAAGRADTLEAQEPF